MDPLSQTIALLKPQPLAWRVFEVRAPWCIRFPATDAVIFGQLIEGLADIRLAGGSRMPFEPGDFLLMAAPSLWLMQSPGISDPAITRRGSMGAGDADGIPEVDLKALIADPGLLGSGQPGAPISRFIAGAFVFAAPNADLLRGLLPPVVHIRGAETAAGRLGALLTLLGDEAMGDRPGRSLVLDRLLEIMLVESARHRSADPARAQSGLLAGLQDAKIGAALRAMHQDGQRPWTVADLARRVGLSRSAFAARFMQTVGMSPMAYLLNWRMNVAKAALVSSKKPMAEIAELAGYQSVSAFSTAFSRTNGCSPSLYAQQKAA
jgi:AraC-like DNA-binding protein